MIDTNTQLTALLGYPIAHSYSPLMHNAAFRKLGLNCEYLPIECKPEALSDIVTGIRRMNFSGFNITMPLKRDILKYLDSIDSKAQLCGCVNTVKKDGNELIGYNTDGDGFIDSLKEVGFSINGRAFVIIGAGGAARAVAAALALEGATVIITARRMEQAVELSGQLPGNCMASTLDTNLYYDCIINATGVGMHPHLDETPIDISLIRKNALVCDLTYNPAKTRFLMEASHIGAPILNGLGMFIYQGARAFEIWFGRQAPVATMRDAVKHRLKEGL